ncbi:homeobox protein otx5-like [Mya arenaria]|uniref:homeobox protein otx5-like n=1 Tax=Mya arenaria TaxID=6604 RepID=UPI0022E64BAA|nr:homeobox protein otx5-like [Mya arenaria]
MSAFLGHTAVEAAADGMEGVRRRRTRTVFSRATVEILEAEFAANRYPDVRLREQLAQEAEVTEARVQVWFQNRRARENRRKRQVAFQETCEVAEQTTKRRRRNTEEEVPPSATDVQHRVTSSTNASSENASSKQHLYQPWSQESVCRVTSSSACSPYPTSEYQGPPSAADDFLENTDDIVERLFRFSAGGRRTHAKIHNKIVMQPYSDLSSSVLDLSVAESRGSDDEERLTGPCVVEEVWKNVLPDSTCSDWNTSY